jgi:hypothetical protein
VRGDLDELKSAFDALPFAARIAAGRFAGAAFSLLGRLVDEIESLKAGGLPSSNLDGVKSDGTRKDRNV